MSKILTRVKRFIGALALRRRFAVILQMIRSDASPIPYTTTHAIPLDFSFPKEFKTADFRGLLFCHTLKGDQANKLTSYWLDKESFHLLADRFQRKLGLACPEFQGSLLDIERRERPWWKPREHFSAREWVCLPFLRSSELA
jgi:hypothetical protein